MAYSKIILLFILLMQGEFTMGQSGIYLEPRLGYGTFHMSEMEEYQRTVINRTGVDAKATDTFGPYFQYGLNVMTILRENSRMGLFYEHGSTGGRVAYADYSGELRFDNLVRYNALGLKFEFLDPIGESSLRFVTGLETSLMLSKLTIDSYSRVLGNTDSSNDKFTAKGLGVKPYIGLQSPVLKLPLMLTLGYLGNVNGPFHVPGEKEQYLVRNHKNDKLKPNWNGLRLNLAVTVPLHH